MIESQGQEPSQGLSEIKNLDHSDESLNIVLQQAKILRNQNNFIESEAKLKNLLNKHSNNYDVLMNLGYLEEKRNRLEVALQYFHAAIEISPQAIKPHLSKIKNLINLNRFQEARISLRNLREVDPNNANIFILSGHLAKKLGQGKKALEFYLSAQKLSASSEQNLSSNILVIEQLINLGQHEEAIKLINEVKPNFPGNIKIQLLQGKILKKQLNLAAAVEIYQNILKIEPNNLDSRIDLAKVYSNLGQVETAIILLEETEQILGSNLKVLIQLGVLYQALENWEKAHHYYQKVCQEYPHNTQGYCHLANLMFLRGAMPWAIRLLQEIQTKIPDSVKIALQLIEFHLALGNFTLGHQILIDIRKKYPHNIQLLWQLYWVHMKQGNYTEAHNVLDQISTDNQESTRKNERLRGNTYLHEYNYVKAEEHFRKAIALAPTAKGERSRLATILMITGRINEARQELKIATEELSRKSFPGKSSVPLKSHIAMITNALRTNPALLEKLQQAQDEQGHERIMALGTVLAQEPNYLGAALYLAREIRVQGIFDGIQQTLSTNLSLNTIPKRIVQFWDQPQVPREVQRICQSWLEHNPAYEYIRFSAQTAVTFLKEHYDQKVLNAFANCHQPATQADFFRLAYLNKMGGFYADADDLCRQSLDDIVNLNPELVVLQEDLACIGNNFLGCIPGQSMIRTAFYQAVINLSRYSNEGPWFSTGPGLITSAVCSGLIPYLSYTDYHIWPRILVLSQAQLRKIINQHIALPYKRTHKSWQQNAYQRRIKVNL